MTIQLAGVMEGNLDDFIEALTMDEQTPAESLLIPKRKT
jgi:hypothetical protein